MLPWMLRSGYLSTYSIIGVKSSFPEEKGPFWWIENIDFSKYCVYIDAVKSFQQF